MDHNKYKEDDTQCMSKRESEQYNRFRSLSLSPETRKGYNGKRTREQGKEEKKREERDILFDESLSSRR